VKSANRLNFSGKSVDKMSEEANLINLTRCLLESIITGNWEAYSELCDPSITCFEPEAKGNLVEGMDFHRFYFDLGHKGAKLQATLVRPHVRLLGDTAVVSYVRLTQVADSTSGAVVTKSAEETRVWQKFDGNWKHVHFHRSVVG
jgi:hypothetical protein